MKGKTIEDYICHEGAVILLFTDGTFKRISTSQPVAFPTLSDPRPISHRCKDCEEK
jgi:hypothetical protein